MTTFSQLVDKMVLELKRPDLQTEIATYVNQTIRELHADPKSGNAVFFDSNLQEAQIQATVDTGQTWTIPKVSTFQGMKAVRYDSLTNGNYQPWTGNPPAPPTPPTTPVCGGYDPDEYVYAEILKPGRGMNNHSHYCYRIQGTYVFNNYGATNAVISLAWYEYPPVLTYYPVGAFPNDALPATPGMRPAQYDEVLGWTYDLPWNLTTDPTGALAATAQALTTNWILLRWPMLIEEGVRAKVYKRVSDDTRAKLAYSMYSSQRAAMYSAEIADIEGGY